MVGVSLGEHKPLEALSIMLKHLGGEVHHEVDHLKRNFDLEYGNY